MNEYKIPIIAAIILCTVCLSISSSAGGAMIYYWKSPSLPKPKLPEKLSENLPSILKPKPISTPTPTIKYGKTISYVNESRGIAGGSLDRLTLNDSNDNTVGPIYQTLGYTTGTGGGQLYWNNKTHTITLHSNDGPWEKITLDGSSDAFFDPPLSKSDTTDTMIANLSQHFMFTIPPLNGDGKICLILSDNHKTGTKIYVSKYNINNINLSKSTMEDNYITYDYKNL
jgi:hypothetical protein